MISLTVCSAMETPELFRAQQPDYVISVMENKDLIEETVPSEVLWTPEHFAFYFTDSTTRSMPEAPTLEDMKQLVNVGWALFPPTSSTSALIHCSAGVSRSPAAAFIFFCIHLGRDREEEAAEKTITCCEQDLVLPNNLMIEYADELLERNGEMVKQRDKFG